MPERAIIVLSGKVLERPFSLDSLDYLRTAIERELRDRGVVATRRVATLSSERFIAAPYILNAGFEAVPADDEDAQAATIVSSEVFAPNAPDEVVMLLGVDEPVELMRAFAFKTRRTLVLDGAPSELLRQNVEGVLDIRGILSKEGVDWASDLKTWDEWSSEFDAALSGGASASASDDNDDAGVVDELCQEVDDSRFVDNADEWNESLERILLSNGLKCSAYQLMNRLDEIYPGVLNFYHQRVREGNFAELLNENIRYLPESPENETAFLCHVSHSEMEPVPAQDAVGLLSIGGSSSEEERRVDSSKELTFGDIVVRADLMREESLWSIERKRLSSDGASYEETLKPRDEELDARGRELSVNLWQIKRDELSDEELQEGAAIYDFVSRAFELLFRVSKAEDVDRKLAVKVLQLAVNSQCMTKTYVKRVIGSPTYDTVQRDAYNLLKSYRETNYSNERMNNMKFDDEVDISELGSFLEELERLDEEFCVRAGRSKDRKELEEKVKYGAKKLREDPGFGRIDYWTQLVARVTELCEKYGAPWSSPIFRTNLRDLIANIPDEVETTETFARVVQDIEVAEQREAEKYEEEFNWAAFEPQYSNELLAVRARFGGTKVVFIGGVPKDHMRSKLEKQLEVELIWEETDHGDSLDRFDKYLRDPDVSLFLIYIPWCSHKHSEEFTKILKEAGKPYARLRKGTNAESMARAVCDQLSIVPSEELAKASEEVGASDE